MAEPFQIAAWQRLVGTVKAFREDDPKTANDLDRAARAWGDAMRSVGGRTMSGQVVPFGRDKGVPIEKASTKSLTWLADVMRESVDDPEKVKYRAQNMTLLSAIEAELETR